MLLKDEQFVEVENSWKEGCGTFGLGRGTLGLEKWG